MLLSKRILSKSLAADTKLILSQFKCFSSEAVEWENAKPYEEIPGMKNAFDIIRFMGPGGKYKDLPLDKLVTSFRQDFGTIAKFPGFLGQRPMVMTFLPEDIETVLRTEGKFPFRRPLDSIEYFRKQHRPDLYPAGAGLTVTLDMLWVSIGCEKSLISSISDKARSGMTSDLRFSRFWCNREQRKFTFQALTRSLVILLISKLDIAAYHVCAFTDKICELVEFEKFEITAAKRRRTFSKTLTNGRLNRLDWLHLTLAWVSLKMLSSRR